MRKLIVTTWMSLDGIFDSASMDQWFNPYHSDSRAQSIQETIHHCEIMLYGRKTYEMLFPYWSQLKNNEMGVAEKLNKVKKYLASTTVNDGGWENTTIIKNDIVKAMGELKRKGDGNILVQGSATLVKTLLEAGLVDAFKFVVQPHIMGTGSGNFFNGMKSGLELTSTQMIDNGVMVLCYKPKLNNQHY
jgi:dihydrofolate reductase